MHIHAKKKRSLLTLFFQFLNENESINNATIYSSGPGTIPSSSGNSPYMLCDGARSLWKYAGVNCGLERKIIKNNTECICGELSSGRFPALHNDSPIDCSDIHKGRVDSWHVCLQARGDSVCNYFECNPSYLDNYKY